MEALNAFSKWPTLVNPVGSAHWLLATLALQV